MPPRRPGFITAFAILNIVFGCLFLFCAVLGTAETTVTVNGRDVTPELKAFMSQEVPGYVACRTLGAVIGMVLAVGLIVAAIGMLRLANWGRILALVCASLSILHQLAMCLFQLRAVNPALTRFLNVLGPVNLGFFVEMWGVIVIVMALAAVLYDILLIVALLSARSARAFSGRRSYDAEEDEYPGERRRPSRRRSSWDEEDEGEEDPDERPRRSRRHPPPEDEGPPPRRRPSRPPDWDEEADDEDGGDAPRRDPRRRR